VDFARKAKIRLRYVGEAFDLEANAVAPANPEAATGASMELARLHASLSKLPPLCRDAVLLNRVETEFEN
jgi:DNA-directed RNA polymerase specialized sigma24 family protein